MHTISVIISVDAAHRLPRHKGKCRYVHGHRYVFHITLSANELDTEGFVQDFKDFKQSISSVLETLDHAYISHKDDPIGHYIESKGLPVVYLREQPTVEVIAKWVYDELQQIGLPVKEVVCYETANCYAGYTQP